MYSSLLGIECYLMSGAGPDFLWRTETVKLVGQIPKAGG